MRQLLRALYFTVITLVWSLPVAWAAPDHRAEFLDWAQAQRAVKGVHPIDEPYTQAHQLWHAAATLVNTFPEIGVERFGEATSGTPLWAFHVPGHGAARRSVLIFGGIHALEWIAVETAWSTLHDVAHRRPEGVDVTVIPLLNPDGRAKVEADLALGHNTYRRGNLSNVDLNRDFSVNRTSKSIWRKLLPRRHATTGSALSQPESRALDALVARERYDRAASLHAFGGFFYFPWSGLWARPDHWATFVHLGRHMEAAQGARAYKTRQLSRWGFFFRAHGSEIDHLYGRYGTHAFLIELTRSGVNPLKVKDFRTYFRWYNPRRPERHVIKGLAAVRALLETDVPPSVQQLDARRMARRRKQTEP